MKLSSNPDVTENCQRPQASPSATLLDALEEIFVREVEWRKKLESPTDFCKGEIDMGERFIITLRAHRESASNSEIRRPGPDAPELNPRRQPGSPASNG